MPTPEVAAFRQSVVASGDALVRAGALSLSQHGNISVLLPDQERLLLTARSSLANLRGEEVALLDRAGGVLEGRLEPTSHEIVRMHTVVYEHLPDVRAVIHTHSPYATAFAVASRAIECVAEVLARFVGTAPIPVARYGPRGSEASWPTSRLSCRSIRGPAPSCSSTMACWSSRTTWSRRPASRSPSRREPSSRSWPASSARCGRCPKTPRAGRSNAGWTSSSGAR